MVAGCLGKDPYWGRLYQCLGLWLASYIAKCNLQDSQIYTALYPISSCMLSVLCHSFTLERLPPNPRIIAGDGNCWNAHARVTLPSLLLLSFFDQLVLRHALPNRTSQIASPYLNPRESHNASKSKTKHSTTLIPDSASPTTHAQSYSCPQEFTPVAPSQKHEEEKKEKEKN